jgi:hypothetical protein
MQMRAVAMTSEYDDTGEQRAARLEARDVLRSLSFTKRAGVRKRQQQVLPPIERRR